MSHIQVSTSAAHVVESQTPIPTTPILDRSNSRTENLFIPPSSGILTFEQWRKNTNDIATMVEPRTEIVRSLKNALFTSLLTHSL